MCYKIKKAGVIPCYLFFHGEEYDGPGV